MNTPLEQDNCGICGKYCFAGYHVNPALSPHVCKECTDLLNQKMLKEEWYKNDQELRLAILQVLYTLRQRNPLKRAADSMICDCLGIKGLFDIGPTLSSLSECGYIKADKPKYLITDQGVQYLLEQVPVLKRLS
jgi:hypothetical protein